MTLAASKVCLYFLYHMMQMQFLMLQLHLQHLATLELLPLWVKTIGLLQGAYEFFFPHIVIHSLFILKGAMGIALMTQHKY